MIPKIIHYCWVGGNPLPKSAQKCIKSWKKYCPDYEIIEWNESNYDFRQNQYMKEAYEAKKWGFVPDYARLDIVYRYGGIYLDTDVELVKPLDDLLQYKGFAGFESPRFVALGLGFGAEAGNRTIKKLMDSYEDLHFIKEDGTLKLTPSPELNTNVLTAEGLLLNNTAQTVGELSVFPTEYFCPKSFETGYITLTENTYSVHHYDSLWYNDAQQEEKLRRWRKSRKEIRQYLIWDKFFHFPNRLGIKLLGHERYNKLKKALGKSSE